MSLKDSANYFETEFNTSKAEFIDGWKSLLRFKSVSTDSVFSADCQQCASWLRSQIDAFSGLTGPADGVSITTELIPTPGKPIVFAEIKVRDPKAKTTLFYGHYDVQPCDPINLWESDPFDPTEKNGRLYARGAQDNKGQLWFFLSAVKSVLKAKRLDTNLKIIIEGEEECGSSGITAVLDSLAPRLKADTLLVCDTGTLDEKVGAITMGLRGMCHLEVKLTGANKDLHSGVHGGLVQNPAVELAKMIGAIHDEGGAVKVPGFYDDIIPIGKTDQTLVNNFPMTADDYLALVGVAPTGGEKKYSMAERRGLRPTIEVNGITSGYQGEGSKTIIPSNASVKFSCRLVVGQDPEKILHSFEGFLRSIAPKALKFEVMHGHASGGALRVSADSDEVRSAAAILSQITDGRPPLYIWEGASIPLIASLATVSGAVPLMVGFGLEEDNIHAPNESFMFEQFRKGFLFCALNLTVGNWDKLQ